MVAAKVAFLCQFREFFGTYCSGSAQARINFRCFSFRMCHCLGSLSTRTANTKNNARQTHKAPKADGDDTKTAQAYRSDERTLRFEIKTGTAC